MIKINLTPIEELENKYWYIPDVIVLMSFVAVGFFSVQFYLQQIQIEIDRTNDERIDFENSYRRLKPDLDRFTQLNKENDQLRRKLNSLKQITVSKISRYKPVILMEHLQNLKPEGLWFNHYYDDSEKEIIQISGRSFDNLLVAEFMSALGSTRLSEIDSSDIRTQVYFSGLHLDKVSTSSARATPNNQLDSPNNLAFQAMQDQSLIDTKGRNITTSGDEIFPELAKFPSFQLNIRYDERGTQDSPPLIK